MLNRDRQGTFRADGIEDALDVFGRTGVGVVSVAHLGHRQEFLEQRSKFQFREERAKRVDVWVTGVHGVDVEFHRYIRVDSRHTLAEQDGVAIVLQGFAVGLALDFGCAIQRRLDRTEALDNLHRAFVADARRSGNVVDGVSAEGHHIDHALGRDAQDLLDLGGVADQVIFRRIQDVHFAVY